MTVKRDDRPRSLERKGLYSIFTRLDPNERLPRERLLERLTPSGISFVHRRFRTLTRKELAASIALPALFLVLVAAGATRLNALETFGLAALTVAGLVALAASGRRRTGE